MLRTLTVLAVLFFFVACTMNDRDVPAAASGTAMVAGSIVEVDLASHRVVLSDARSHSRIAIDVSSVASPSLSELHTGDCATFSGAWKGNDFTAATLDSVRPGCHS
jgi:hypothetical protein